MHEITVRLKAPHTHSGEQKKAGDIITVSQPIADWLIARGIAEIITK
jgi:hypothetical protein